VLQVWLQNEPRKVSKRTLLSAVSKFRAGRFTFNPTQYSSTNPTTLVFLQGFTSLLDDTHPSAIYTPLLVVYVFMELCFHNRRFFHHRDPPALAALGGHASVLCLIDFTWIFFFNVRRELSPLETFLAGRAGPLTPVVGNSSTAKSPKKGEPTDRNPVFHRRDLDLVKSVDRFPVSGHNKQATPYDL